MSDLFTLTCEKIPDLAFVGFRGKEYISRPFEFELFFTVPMGTPVRDAVGARATLKGGRSEDHPVVFHGVIAQVALVHQHNGKKQTEHDRTLYRALLVPRLWLLQHFWRSFVFTGKNVKEFLSDTLEAGGLVADEFRFDINEGSYAKEEFVAQYRESHLDFFHRWLEREGLYYYFEHKPDAASEVLVIVEDKSHSEPFPGGGAVNFHPIVGDDATAPEALHELEADTRWLPKTVTLADYDYSNPTMKVKADGAVTPHGIGTIRDYGYRMFVEADAKRLAKIKAESIGCRETTLRGSGTCVGPRAGYKLSIQQRPDDLDEEWLAIEVEHMASMRARTGEIARLTGLSSTRVYSMKLLAIPASTQFRAPQTTAWPRIYGVENAIVMGEADSPYAQIDADGRYLVRFEFDTSDLPDGKVSTRVRMLQPHGGETEGFHFPLRKGTEVMISFLGGDPDRPFIAGVVPNARKPSVVGKRNHTQNVIRTGSSNQIVMEDEKGKEFIFMHTPNQKTGIYMGNPAGTHSSVYTGEDAEVSTTVTVPGPGFVSNGRPGLPIPQGPSKMTAALHLHTEQNHIFGIGGDSMTIVGKDESTYVAGNTIHGYKGVYGKLVGETAMEFYYGVRDTTTFGLRKDTAKARLEQTVAEGGFQRVTGDWEHKVSQKNTDTYGEWKTTVVGPWNSQTSDWSHKSPNVTWTVGTKVEINAPTVVIKGVSIEKHVESWFEKHSIKNEAYVGKNAVGIEKFDGCVSSNAVTAVKAEATGIARSFTALKIENVGISKATTVLKIEDTAYVQRINAGENVSGAFSLTNRALRLLQHAFCKV
ncbi:MAG: type VI secretion system tip protein TssI/VgrG [Polyangiaceae bacterium]